MTNKIIRIDDLQKGFRDTFLKNYSPEELNKKLEESFYGILANDDTLYNPLSPLPFGVSTPEYFPKYMIYLMNRPEYFYLIIKTLFGMESFPIQGLILRELYAHRFPILLGSRGLSKCLQKSALVITNKGIRTIGDLIPEDKESLPQPLSGQLLGENKYTDIRFGFYNGEKATKIIKTKSGRTIEATLNHPLRIVSDGEIVWKNAEDIQVGDYMPIVREVKEWEYEELDKDVAYMVGAMVGDGCYTEKFNGLGFTNVDQECIDNLKIGLKKWNRQSELKLINSKRRKKIQYFISGGNSIRKKFVKDFRTNAYSKQIGKLTPNKIFSASFEAIAAYLQGLFDTDGCCATRVPIAELSTKTKRLAEETQFLLMCLGINSSLKTQRNKKYNKDYYKLQISGSSLRVFRDKVGFRITRKQNMLERHCSRPTNENLDIVPHELILDKLLKLRELARDTTYGNGHGYNYDRQLISPHKIRSYQPSYDTLNKMLDLFSKSKAASESKEFADLCGIAQLAHYYDEVTEITDGFCKTYDVELVEDHSFISNGFISHNTTLLGMYLLIKMLLTPGIKCVITGAGFRQAKLLFNVMESIWDKAPILQSCFKGKSQGPSHGTDVWTFRMGDSITYALPVGPDGSKVRGYRANLLVCVDRDTLVQTDSGLVKIVDYMREDCMEVMNSLGEFERPKNFIKTDKIDVYEVKTQNGYSIKCSEHHKLLVTDGKNTKWKLAKDLTSDDFLELDNNDYFPKEIKGGVTKDVAQLMGASHSNNELPKEILQSPREVVIEFLRGLFVGYSEKKIDVNNNVVYFAISRQLISQLQILLLKFNIISSIDGLELFVSGQDLHDLLENGCVVRSAGRPTMRVKSVVKLDKQDHLYDFTMAEDHSFCAGGFINHNCDEFSCTRNSIISTDLGLLRVEDIVNNKIKCNVYNYHGELEPIIGYVKTPKTQVYRLTTKYGYEIDFSENHKFMLEDGKWKLGKDLTKKDFIRFDHIHPFKGATLPKFKNIKEKDLCKFIGLLVSEGDLTKKTSVSITNTDKKLIDELKSVFSELNPKIYIREAYEDKRGWKCKKIYNLIIHNAEFRKYLEDLGLDYVTAHKKRIPNKLMNLSKKSTLALLQGLFIGDGSVFNFTDKLRGKIRLGAAYYSVSKGLIDDLHVILKYMGYISYKNYRKSNLSENKQWFIRLNGTHALEFIKDVKYPNYKNFIKKSDKITDRFIDHKGCVVHHVDKSDNDRFYARAYYNGRNIPLGVFDSYELAENKIRDFNKTRILCVQVKSVELLDEEDHLYDIALPTTHSYYANGLVNHNTIQRHVFEEVMSGFLSVSSSVIEQVKTSAKNLAIDRLKIPVAFDEGDEYTLHNQLVLSGTAYYKHNHFYEYFKKWRDIISSGGNEKKLKEIFGEDQDVSRVNYRNYSILRVPIELIPEGQMDMEQIDRIKASSSKSVYMREYACCFTNDSDGFYKKSLIDSCTVGSSWLPVKKDGKEINFGASLIGDKNCKYVYGVDPAYQGDNFAIVILEVHENHRRVVYCWTTQANEHKQLLKDEIIQEHNYYEYCSRKIRNLMKTFPCAYIALDPLGGGKNILECLMDPTKLRPGEVRILPTIDRNSKPKETDLMEGEHIIEIASNSPTWIAEANYAMKKDMETRDLLFPSCDDTTYVIADFYDSEMSKVSELYDTLEDCVTEIEELKKELTIITVSETATGKEHFDTYEVKGGATTKKTRLKKDRYSALLMANWYARTNEFFVTRALGPDLITMSGFESSSCPGALYGGNNELAKRLQSLYE